MFVDVFALRTTGREAIREGRAKGVGQNGTLKTFVKNWTMQMNSSTTRRRRPFTTLSTRQLMAWRRLMVVHTQKSRQIWSSPQQILLCSLM
jgi:hypothetical protein